MQSLRLPDWAGPDSRYAKNLVSYLWTTGNQYKHIPYSYADTKDSKGNALKMWDKKPSVNLNMPALSARISARRLFVGKHAPVFDNKNKKVKEAFHWLCKNIDLFWYGLDCARQGQAGSAAFILKLAKGKPVIQVKPGKDCKPYYDDAGELEKFQLSYVIKGYSAIERGLGPNDCNGAEISPDSQYWFVRLWNKEAMATCKPIPISDWNPEEGFAQNSVGSFQPIKELSDEHNLGFVPVVWVENMPDGDAIDGLSSYDLALQNCCHLDFTLSQFGRGLNYMGNPMLAVKGKILSNGGSVAYSMDNYLQLPPDRKDTNGSSVGGAEAKLLEMSAEGIKVGMEMWVDKMREWTRGLMSQSNLDHNKIKGQLSGSAIMLLDEDFFDGVELMKMSYGTRGIVKVAIMIAEMLIKLGDTPQLAGIKSKDFEEMELDWPATYEPEYQEVQFLVDALNEGVAGGLMSVPEASEILSVAVDKELTPTEPAANDMLAQPGKEQDDNLELKKKELQIKDKVASKPAPKPAARP